MKDINGKTILPESGLFIAIGWGLGIATVKLLDWLASRRSPPEA